MTRPVLLILAIVLTGCGQASPTPPAAERSWKPRAGSLEFCVVANEADDEDGIAAARKALEKLPKEEGRRLAEEGKPPPAPKPPDGKRFAANGEYASYRWAELGRAGRQQLGLGEESGARLREDLAAARAKGEPFLYRLAADPATSCVLYSRECRDRSLAETERTAKGFDLFLLLRVIDEQRLTEEHLASFTPGMIEDGSRCIDGSMTPEGGKLLRAITEANRPGRGVGRQLAIVVAGQVISYPLIRDAIGERFQITGNFTEDDVKRMLKEVTGDERGATR